jgi:hypothetical protein
MILQALQINLLAYAYALLLGYLWSDRCAENPPETP